MNIFSFFKRKPFCVYLVDVYPSGREHRAVVPATLMADGRWVVAYHGGVLPLLPAGKVAGESDKRWEALDDIPGLTDGEVTPAEAIELLTEECEALKHQLETFADTVRRFKSAKNGTTLRRAESDLDAALRAAAETVAGAGR